MSVALVSFDRVVCPNPLEAFRESGRLKGMTYLPSGLAFAQPAPMDQEIQRNEQQEDCGGRGDELPMLHRFHDRTVSPDWRTRILIPFAAYAVPDLEQARSFLRI